MAINKSFAALLFLIALVLDGCYAVNKLVTNNPFGLLNLQKKFISGPVPDSIIIESLDNDYEYYYFQPEMEKELEHPIISSKRYRGEFLEINSSFEYVFLSLFVKQEALISSHSYHTFINPKDKLGHSCVCLKKGPTVTEPTNGCSNHTGFMCKVAISDSSHFK